MILEDDSQIIRKSTGTVQQEAQLLRAAKELQQLYLLYITDQLRQVSKYGSIVAFIFSACKNGRNFWKIDISNPYSIRVVVPLYHDSFKPGGEYDANDLTKLVLYFKNRIKLRMSVLKDACPDHYLYFRRDLIQLNRKKVDYLIR